MSKLALRMVGLAPLSTSVGFWLCRGVLHKTRARCTLPETKSAGQQSRVAWWLTLEGAGLLQAHSASSHAWLPSLPQSCGDPGFSLRSHPAGRRRACLLLNGISRRQHETLAVAFVRPELDTWPHADVTNASLLPIKQTSLSAVMLTPWRRGPQAGTHTDHTASSQLSAYLTVAEQESVHPAGAEPDTGHRESQWRIVGYFIDERCHLGEQELLLKSPNCPLAWRLQTIGGKITGHHGLESKVVLGADWSEVR